MNAPNNDFDAQGTDVGYGQTAQAHSVQTRAVRKSEGPSKGHA